MSNRDIDELLYNLRKRMIDKYQNFELSILLSSDSLDNYIKYEFSYDEKNITEKLIKKIVTDFYAYYLYKIEIGDEIEDESKEIIDYLNELSSDNFINYIRENIYNFSFIISKYYEYHEMSIFYQRMVIANVINKRKSLEFISLYGDFFSVDFNYESLVLPNYVNIGLDMRDFYYKSMDDKKIIEFLKIEFENKIDRNNFLNYILSNVYAYIKLNGCININEENIIKLTERLDKRMKCYYEYDEYVINLVKKYFDIYGDVKWFEFKDIRDYLPFSEVELIYKLDNNYKHPDDVVKNAFSFTTVMNDVSSFLNNILEQFILNDKSDFEISNWFIRLLNGEISITFEENLFNYEKKYFINLIKLYLLSSFYEYSNYILDDLSLDEMRIFNYIDNGLDIEEGLSLFEDCDEEVIVDLVLKYLFDKEKTEFMARKKIVDDGKLEKVLKVNPYMILEYRRIFGVLFPYETSKSTEYGNIIMETLFSIISLSKDLEDEYGIKYQDLSQMFKNDFYNIQMDHDELVGFILSNVYENLVCKNDLNDDEKFFITGMENNMININEIINNDYCFGELLLYFFNLNGEFFNDDRLRELRRNLDKDKVKILKRYDPFYEIDNDILK